MPGVKSGSQALSAPRTEPDKTATAQNRASQGMEAGRSPWKRRKTAAGTSPMGEATDRMKDSPPGAFPPAETVPPLPSRMALG